VVGAAGEVAGETIGERGAEGGEGAGDFETGAGEEGLAGGQAEFDRLGGIEGAGADFTQVVRGMDAEQGGFGCGFDGVDRQVGRGGVADHRLRSPELVHGEGVLLRQRKRVVGMVEATHGVKVPELVRKIPAGNLFSTD